jgi:4-carboxymuconolactone decarboxylase
MDMIGPRANRRRMWGALALAVASIFAVSMTSNAQDRMPLIPDDKMTDAQKKAVAGGRPIGPFVPLLRSPEVLIPARTVVGYLRSRSALPLKLRELAIIVTARQWTQQYEWGAHYHTAISAGLSADIVNAIADGRRPAKMAEDEEIIYDFCVELHRNHGVSDATYARALSKFGEQGVIDTVSINGFYTFLAMVMNTARTPPPDGAQYPCPVERCDSPPLTRFPQ